MIMHLHDIVARSGSADWETYKISDGPTCGIRCAVRRND